jgi:hypothetical protein
MRGYKALPCRLSSCKSAPTAAISPEICRPGRGGLLFIGKGSKFGFGVCVYCWPTAGLPMARCAARRPLSSHYLFLQRHRHTFRFGTAEFVVLARMACHLFSLGPSCPPVRHSRAPDCCARIAREHRAPRSNICACAGTSEPSRALRCMIIYCCYQSHLTPPPSLPPWH